MNYRDTLWQIEIEARTNETRLNEREPKLDNTGEAWLNKDKGQLCKKHATNTMMGDTKLANTRTKHEKQKVDTNKTKLEETSSSLTRRVS